MQKVKSYRMARQMLECYAQRTMHATGAWMVPIAILE